MRTVFLIEFIFAIKEFLILCQSAEYISVILFEAVHMYISSFNSYISTYKENYRFLLST